MARTLSVGSPLPTKGNKNLDLSAAISFWCGGSGGGWVSLLHWSMLLNLSLGIRPKPDSAGLLDTFKIKGFTQNVKHFSLTSNDRSLWKSFGRRGLHFSQEKMTSWCKWPLTFHRLHSGRLLWPLWVHSQSETSQRVAICLCQILPPLPTRPLTSQPTLLCQHFRNEKRTYKSSKYMEFMPHIWENQKPWLLVFHYYLRVSCI